MKSSFYKDTRYKDTHLQNILFKAPFFRQHYQQKEVLKMKRKLIIAVLLGLICLSNLELSEQIDKDSLIRIHVLANSDSEADQKLKLQVKDEVVRFLQPQLAQSHSVAESRQIIQSNLPQIQQTAKNKLTQLNSNYNVTLQYGHFDFPVKYYGNFSLPAGNYEALRILIGEGKGHNWWCVLFPPMCFTDSNTSSSGKYTDQTPEKKVVVKFKSVELLKKWTGHDETKTNKETK